MKTRTDDRLSRAASVILKFGLAEQEIAEDLHAFFAPSECYADTYRWHEKQLTTALNALGFADEDEVQFALDERGVSLHNSIYRAITH
jgi:hypothetical protein